MCPPLSRDSHPCLWESPWSHVLPEKVHGRFAWPSFVICTCGKSPSGSLLLLQTRVLGFPQLVEIDQRPDKTFRLGFLGPLLQQGGNENKSQVPLLARSLTGRAGSLYAVREGVCPGSGPEVWLRWPAHPFRGAVCTGHTQCAAFAPDPLLLFLAL